MHTIVLVLVIVFVLCYGSRYYTVMTDPVDLWVASNSQVRQETAYFPRKKIVDKTAVNPGFLRATAISHDRIAVSHK